MGDGLVDAKGVFTAAVLHYALPTGNTTCLALTCTRDRPRLSTCAQHDSYQILTSPFTGFKKISFFNFSGISPNSLLLGFSMLSQVCPPWLGCCVRLPRLVLLLSPVLSPNLSTILAGLGCCVCLHGLHHSSIAGLLFVRNDKITAGKESKDKFHV